MKTNIQGLAIAGALILVGAAAPLSAQTLGDRLDQGTLSVGGFEQLIAGTGLSSDEGRRATLADVVRIRWQDD